MRRVGLVVVLVLGMSGAGCGGHGRPRGTIVFTTFDAGRVAFYGVRPDGTGLVRLPPGTAPYGTAAAWSPDGTKALVAGDKSAYVFDRAKGVRRQIRIPRLDPGDTGAAPWSPDGERLLLSTDAGNVVFEVKTGRWHAISTPDDPGEPAVWSGDGKELLFTSGADLGAAPVDGGPARTVVRIRSAESVYDPMSSADGRWFSFGVNEGAREWLYVVRSDGTHPHRVASGFDLSSAWSPTGERLAYAE